MAEIGHSLKRNIFYAVLGNGLFNLCRLAVVVLLAKLALPEIQGTFTYASIALATPVVLFCGLELRAAYVADIAGEFTFGAYRALRSLGMGAAAVILVGVAFWSTRGEPLSARNWLILAVCGGRIAFGLAEVYWGVFQRRERLDLMAGSNALRGLTMLATFAIAYLLFRPTLTENSPGLRDELTRLAAWASLGYLLAWLLIWWFFDRPRVVNQPDVKLDWDWKTLWKLTRQTFPLGLVTLLIALCETVTQWMIKHAGGNTGWEQLGYFGAMRILTLVATFLIVQISTAAGNRLANYYQKDLPAFVRLATRLTGVAIVLGAAFLLFAWIFGRWFLYTAYTPRYAEHYHDFLVLVGAQAVILLAAVFGSVTTHMRRFWIQVPVHLLVLTTTAIGGAILIRPEDPVGGGARTMLVRSIAQASLYLGCVLLGIHWQKKTLQH